MGQYRLWLHYREIDQLLRAQLETFERDLHDLQEQLLQFDSNPTMDNSIVQALLNSFKGGQSSEVGKMGNAVSTLDDVLPQQLEEEVSRDEGGQVVPSAASGHPSVPGESVSSALFGWGHLPNLGDPLSHEPVPPTHDQLSTSSFSHHEPELLPENMVAFFDEHALTGADITPPWWLTSTQEVAAQDHGVRDSEGQRTDISVQRWRERFQRAPESSEPGDLEE